MPRACFGNSFRAKTRGVLCTVPEIPVHVVSAASALQIFLFTRKTVILGVCHAVKGLGEEIAALTQRLAVGSDREVHTVSRLAVDAIFFHKIKAALGCLHPFGTLAVQGTKTGEGPRAASLHPHAFVGGVDLARAVKAGVDAAVLAVNAVLQPKAYAALQLRSDPRARLAHFLFILYHNSSPLV